MKSILGLIFLSASLALCGCTDITTRTYNYGTADETKDQMAFVSGSLKFAQGVVIIREIDGKDSRTHPLLQAYANSKAPPLAPRKVLVQPGDHTFGVLYLFVDALSDGPESSLWWGKYLASDLAKNAKDRYAPDPQYVPDNRDHVITIKHFAEVAFHCNAKSSCEIYPVIDESQAKISFTVKECGSGEHGCVVINSKSSAEKTAVVPGWSYTDI